MHYFKISLFVLFYTAPLFADSIVMKGTGEVKVKPDIARISISVITTEKTATKSAEENAVKSSKVIKFLKNYTSDVQTSSYNLSPKYVFPGEKLVGYTVNHTLSFKLTDISKTGEILDGIVSKGANKFNFITYDVADREKYTFQARQKAFEQAKTKMEFYQLTANLKIGKITELREMDSFNHSGLKVRTFAEKSTTTVLPGKLSIVVSVLVAWELK